MASVRQAVRRADAVLREIVLSRRASAVDANQASIVAALRAVGASVQLLHKVGGGCPDLLVGHRGTNHIFEVKDGSLPPSGRRLNARQVKWHGEWRGHVVVVESVEDALAAIGVR